MNTHPTRIAVFLHKPFKLSVRLWPKVEVLTDGLQHFRMCGWKTQSGHLIKNLTHTVLMEESQNIYLWIHFFIT